MNTMEEGGASVNTMEERGASVVHFVEETGVLSGRFSNFPKAEESYSLCSRAHVLNGFILGSIVWLLHSFSGLKGPHFSAPQTLRVSFLWGGERQASVYPGLICLQTWNCSLASDLGLGCGPGRVSLLCLLKDSH